MTITVCSHEGTWRRDTQVHLYSQQLNQEGVMMESSMQLQSGPEGHDVWQVDEETVVAVVSSRKE